MSAIPRMFCVLLWNLAALLILTCSFSWWGSFPNISFRGGGGWRAFIPRGRGWGDRNRNSTARGRLVTQSHAAWIANLLVSRNSVPWDTKDFSGNSLAWEWKSREVKLAQWSSSAPPTTVTRVRSWSRENGGSYFDSEGLFPGSLVFLPPQKNQLSLLSSGLSMSLSGSGDWVTTPNVPNATALSTSQFA